MPELPDITVYLDALETRVVGRPLLKVRLRSPFLLRTVEPPLQAVEGLPVTALRRMGKRIVFVMGDELFLVLHLMIAGRLRWLPPGGRIPGKLGLAAFDFSPGTLLLTEAGTKPRASLHLLRGEAALAAHDPGGAEVLALTLADVTRILHGVRHTLKRALTDPRLFSGIGNAYSDEILHRARLSPFLLTNGLDAAQTKRLYDAMRGTLGDWIARLREEAGTDFPKHVTAFREGMAVHGRHGQPCPDCGHPVQRIRYADRELNYCAHCQTGGRLLADRALSRLLREDFPRTLEELERLLPAPPPAPR